MRRVWQGKQDEYWTWHPEALFFYSARFKSAEEAFKYIESEKAAKDNTIKNLAKISHAYEGAISYHKLKEAPAREISLILEAIEEIRKDQEKQMKSAQSGNKNQTTIGFENPWQNFHSVVS